MLVGATKIAHDLTDSGIPIQKRTDADTSIPVKKERKNPDNLCG